MKDPIESDSPFLCCEFPLILGKWVFSLCLNISVPCKEKKLNRSWNHWLSLSWVIGILQPSVPNPLLTSHTLGSGWFHRLWCFLQWLLWWWLSNQTHFLSLRLQWLIFRRHHHLGVFPEDSVLPSPFPESVSGFLPIFWAWIYSDVRGSGDRNETSLSLSV